MKPDRIKNWPSTERPRERLIAEGPERLTDAELLAITLRVGSGTFKTGVPGQTAISLARSLLVEFRGLHGLDRAHIPDLLKVKGLSIAKVSQIKAAFEIGKHLRTNAVRPRSFDSASEVAAYPEPRLTRARQEFLRVLTEEYGYSPDQFAEEEEVTGRGSGQARADFVIWRSAQDKLDSKNPLIVIECKADNVTIKPQDYWQGDHYARLTGALFVAATRDVEVLIVVTEKGSYSPFLEDIQS